MTEISVIDGQALSSDALAERFGALRLDLLVQRMNIGLRVSCLRRAADGVPLAASVVRFHPFGAATFGAHHDRVLRGELLGATIASSGMRFRRTAGKVMTVPSTFATRYLFNSASQVLPSRVVEYDIEGDPYCRIRELYNPELFAVDGSMPDQESDDVPFLIARLHPSFGDAYLRLAHGFLKKDMHVGIVSEDAFVAATRRTLGYLLHDANTHIFVAVDRDRFVGYASVNIHPALHINGFECAVRELFVRPESRRLGIATALIDYVERFSRVRGCKRLALATNWTVDDQRLFYEAIGFTRRCDFATKLL